MTENCVSAKKKILFTSCPAEMYHSFSSLSEHHCNKEYSDPLEEKNLKLWCSKQHAGFTQKLKTSAETDHHSFLICITRNLNMQEETSFYKSAPSSVFLIEELSWTCTKCATALLKSRGILTARFYQKSLTLNKNP